MPELSAEETFPLSPEAPRRARSWVRSLLEGWGVGDADGLILLAVSELTTNAVKHGGSGFSLSIQVCGDAVVIRVGDASPEGPVTRPVPADAEAGRGIVILSALADGWGVEERSQHEGKTVWARISTRP